MTKFNFKWQFCIGAYKIDLRFNGRFSAKFVIFLLIVFHNASLPWNINERKGYMHNTIYKKDNHPNSTNVTGLSEKIV